MKGSDRINLFSDCSIAFIENIVVNIDEPVIIKLLGFHVKDKLYCNSYELLEANKRFCEEIKLKYVHFQITKEMPAAERIMFIIAFLPRIKLDSELDLIIKEISATIDLLEINQTVNCLLFRFGKPRHQTDNKFKWQKQFDKKLAEINKKYKLGLINGRIKHVREDNEKCLIISSALLFDSINVS